MMQAVLCARETLPCNLLAQRFLARIAVVEDVNGTSSSIPFADGLTIPTNVPNPLKSASAGAVGPSKPAKQPAPVATSDPRRHSGPGGQEAMGGEVTGGSNMQQMQLQVTHPPPPFLAGASQPTAESSPCTPPSLPVRRRSNCKPLLPIMA